MICLLFLNFLTLKIATKAVKNCTIAKSKSFPISNDTNKIKIVDVINAIVVSSKTVSKIEIIDIGII